MAPRQKLELNLTNTNEMSFKAPLVGYILRLDDGEYLVGHYELSIKVTGKTPQQAAELLKDTFIELATDIISKSKYASLSERERNKLEIIKSICNIGTE